VRGRDCANEERGCGGCDRYLELWLEKLEGRGGWNVIFPVYAIAGGFLIVLYFIHENGAV